MVLSDQGSINDIEINPVVEVLSDGFNLDSMNIFVCTMTMETQYFQLIEHALHIY